MRVPRRSLTALGALALATTLAACSATSDGGTDPSPIQAATPTGATSVPSATGAPITGTPTVSPAPGSGASGGSGAPGGGSVSGGGGGSNASGPGLCTPTVATFAVGQADGAAGTSFLPVTVTNASQQPCVTTGYPGVALLNAAGAQVVQAARETRAGLSSTTITLAPGDKATALISTSPAAADGSACVTSPAFLFTLPDNTDATRLTAILSTCSVRVRPFVKGSTGLS